MEKQFKQGYLCELGLKSLPELVDLQRRQYAILANKRLLQTLPDKGEKARTLLARIEIAIAAKAVKMQKYTRTDTSAASTPSDLDKYVVALAEKFDSQLNIENPVFKPCRTLNMSAPAKSGTAAVDEESRDAVRIPSLRHNPPEILKLTETFKLQTQHVEQLKELKTHHNFSGPSPSVGTSSMIMNDITEALADVFESDDNKEHDEDDG